MSEKETKQAPETEADGAGDAEAPANEPDSGAGQAARPKINLDELPDVEEIMPGLADEIAAAASAEQESDPLSGLLAERDDLKDKLLRALAESENIRRRAERDRKDAEAYGGTRLARDLLAVHDNLDRALSHVDDGLRETAQGFIEGVELTQRELLNAFAKHKIEKVSPAIGEKFDPKWHQAMFEAPIPGATPGSVIEVMQAGFTIAERLLRPALVGVARAVPEAPKDQTAETPRKPADEPAEAAAHRDDPEADSKSN